MDLVEIKDFPNYSLDKNTNQIYSHTRNKYLKPYLDTKQYYQVKLYNKSKSLHRLIYQSYNPNIDISNLCIDHIDMNQQNNKIENLRHCNRSENNCNKKVQKNNLSTGVKNISFRNNIYTVIITKKKKRYEKRFKTLEEAITYRDNKLVELHNEFANLG
jgi:hypothetical protein